LGKNIMSTSTSTWTGAANSDWDDADNWSPAGVPGASSVGLIADANGDLFGTTYNGGANNGGTVFGSTGSGFVANPVAGIALGSGSANGINEAGQAVGFGDVGGVGRAVEWTDGQTITLPGAGSDATSINNAGQVVGYIHGGREAVEWVNGQLIDLGGPPESAAEAINDAGQVAGGGSVNGVGVALEWSGGQVIDLGGLPGSTYSLATAINDAGQVAGYSIVGGVYHGAEMILELKKPRNGAARLWRRSSGTTTAIGI
jgi:probable HAF family extracellular repeat protein